MATEINVPREAAGANLEQFTGGAIPFVERMVRLARRKPLGVIGLVILLVIGTAAVFAPVIAPFGYSEGSRAFRLEGPSAAHIFGTDELGRDLFSRILYGTRSSFGISFAAVIMAEVIATIVALTSAYYRGWYDTVLQRFVDIYMAVPLLIILITIVAIAGSSIPTLILVVGLGLAPNTSRLLRSVAIGVREEAYVEAAHALGASSRRVMLQHILPNMFHMIMYSSTVLLGSVVLIIASLGFLGYGVPPPYPDLGAMLSGSALTYMRQNPWMAIWPGLVIALGVFAFGVFGDALRDVLDPRMRGS